MFAKYTKFILFITGLVLTIDGFVLIALLKINFGTVVPFLLGLIFLIHALFWQKIALLLAKSHLLKRLWQFLWAVFLIWLTSFMFFVYTLKQHLNTQKNLPKLDAIIVLGAGVNDDKPTPALASRLDKASQIILTQPDIVPIVSGGVGIGRTTSEAEVMANYLHNTYNIPLDKIQLEKQSTSTQTNLEFSKLILQAHHISLDNPIAVVTNDFHTIRAQAIAKKQGYGNVTMVASETPLSIRANAWFREYFAFVSGWLLQEY